MAGQEFEFVKRRKNWRADRVYLIDASGELVSLPAEWTDVVAPDIFVVVSAGRSAFHIAGLVELAGLVEELAARCRSGVRRLRRECPADYAVERSWTRSDKAA